MGPSGRPRPLPRTGPRPRAQRGERDMHGRQTVVDYSACPQLSTARSIQRRILIPSRPSANRPPEAGVRQRIAADRFDRPCEPLNRQIDVLGSGIEALQSPRPLHVVLVGDRRGGAAGGEGDGGLRDRATRSSSAVVAPTTVSWFVFVLDWSAR